MSNPNNESPFNPAYSTIKIVSLETKDGNNKFTISQKNEECQYERLELAENVNDIFPNGALLVRDTKDIITFIKSKKLEVVRFDYIDNSISKDDITSISHINNAASETEENFISINFSNRYYKYMQSSSLINDMPGFKPWVYLISDYMAYAANYILVNALTDEEIEIAKKDQNKLINGTKNYALYRPLNPTENKIEAPADNTIQYMNYLASMACGCGQGLTGATGADPRYMFWTNWKNQVNFKFFDRDIENDPNASDAILSANYLKFIISSGDVPLVTISKNVKEGEKTKKKKSIYRKIYHFRSDPSDQFISKNYFYIKKTPKYLDNPPIGVTGATYTNYTTKALTYHYMDESDKYNYYVVSSSYGITYSGFTAGADEISYDKHWGYYNSLFQPNGRSNLTFLGDDLGNAKIYSDMNLVGWTGYMPFVDNVQMWKNMFDMTEIHPNYPYTNGFTVKGMSGIDTNLQKVMNIRYSVFKKYIDNQAIQTKKENERLELMRKIENQNFLMYVLCCMSKEEQSFFALLTKYEKDNSYATTDGSRVPYRYNWVKLNFNSPYGLCGPTGACGGISGATYYMHQIERWSRDPLVKGNTTQDDTWAINLNEHGLTLGYLPPGWVSNLPTGFNWRPIGSSSASISDSSQINHVVRMNVVPMTDLLLDSHQAITENYLGKYLYYFTATNVVDGSC